MNNCTNCKEEINKGEEFYKLKQESLHPFCNDCVDKSKSFFRKSEASNILLKPKRRK